MVFISFIISKEAAGYTLHTIIEATDNGVPPLTSYRRVIVIL